MISHAQHMIQKSQEYSRTDATFLTQLADTAISITFEPHHPILKRPRWVVTCPEHSTIAQIQREFHKNKWPDGVFDLWWEKNGKQLVRRDQLDDLSNDDLIKQFDGDVRSMANVAYRKIRKPASHDFDDLVSEGHMALIQSYRRWWKPGGKATLRTFLMWCLRTTYADIVKASYKEPQSIDIAEKVDLPAVAVLPPEDSADFKELLQNFNTQEIEYIERTFSFLGGDRRTLRKEVRADMGITFEEETTLRATIQEKIRKNGV